MAFTGRLRLLYPLTKTVPIIMSAGFGFSVYASEYEHLDVKVVQPPTTIPEFHIPKVPKIGPTVSVRPASTSPIGCPVPILNISSDQVKIDTFALTQVLDKIGNRPVAIYSVNGPMRTGKSFLLNYFLRYLKYRELEDIEEGENDINRRSPASWMDFGYPHPNDTLTGFVWKGETVRCTNGIQIWSEPFELTMKDGRKVAVLLIDCQGAFDDQSSMNQNAIIFAISTLLSSVVIFNIMKQIEESSMQFLQVFAEYSSAMSIVDRRTTAGSTGASFQKLIILVRDFDFSDYKLGHYSNTTRPEGELKNYRDAKIKPQSHQPKEIQDNRMRILEQFDDISIYLMPDPGRLLRRHDRADELESDFRAHLQNFVETTLDPENIITKNVNGVEVTGTQFRDYVSAWGKLEWTRELPTLQTIRQSNQEVHYYHIMEEVIESYHTLMKPVRQSEYKMELPEVDKKHEAAVAKCNELFHQKRKIGGVEMQDRFDKEFKTKAEKILEEIKSANSLKPNDTYWERILSYSKWIVGPLISIIFKFI